MPASHNKIIDSTEPAQIRLAALIDSLPLGLVMTDENDEPIMTNRNLARMLNYDSDKTIASQLNDYFSLKDICGACRKDKRACKPHEIEIDGSFFRLLVTPIISDNVAYGTVVLLEDVTEKKLLDRSRDEFFAIASHELRTPLTAIRSSADMILNYYNDVLHGHQDLARMIQDMYGSSVRLIGLVNDFLDASKLELGRMKFAKENVDVLLLVKEVIQELRPNAISKGIALGFESEDTSLSALGDPQRIREILVNLIGNAMKFTEEGGVVVGVCSNDDQIEIRVTDTGPGIAREQQKLLFKKFQQAGKSFLSRQIAEGTGMGLYISRLMAVGMKGKLGVEKSAEGEGSTFLLTLPINK